MNDYEKYLAQVIPEKDCLKTVKAEAKRFYKTHSPAECLDTGMSLYQSENFQIQETARNEKAERYFHKLCRLTI